ALFQAIIDHVPVPDVDVDGPFQMQISQLDYNSFLGVIGIGRIARGKIKSNTPVVAISDDGTKRNGRILKIMGHSGLQRVEVAEAEAGDIVCVSAWKSCSSPTPCATRRTSKPSAPDRRPADREHDLPGQRLALRRQGRQVRHQPQHQGRLEKELLHNVACASKRASPPRSSRTARSRSLRERHHRHRRAAPGLGDGADGPAQGRSDQHDPRRQGPCAPGIHHPGAWPDRLPQQLPDPDFGHRHPDLDLQPLRPDQGRRSQQPSERRSGLHGHRHRPDLLAGNPAEPRQAVPGSGDEIYEGQLAGINSRDNDLVINPTKGKKLDNMRASGKDEVIALVPPIKFTLEQALEFIADDELVEVTPKSIRLRKKMLNENDRKRYERSKRPAAPGSPLFIRKNHESDFPGLPGGAGLADPRLRITARPRHPPSHTLRQYHANLEIAGQRYTLDAYIVMFQKPFYITVQRDDRRPMSIDEAARAAEEYIKPRDARNRSSVVPIWTAATLTRPSGWSVSSADPQGAHEPGQGHHRGRHRRDGEVPGGGVRLTTVHGRASSRPLIATCRPWHRQTPPCPAHRQGNGSEGAHHLGPDPRRAFHVALGFGVAQLPGRHGVDLPAMGRPQGTEAGAGETAVVVVRGPGVLVQAHFAVVDEGGELPGLGEGVAQLDVGQPALVAGGLALGVGAHAIGAAQVKLLGAVQVAVGPLALELGVEAEAIAQALQAHQAGVELVEAATGAGGGVVGALGLGAIKSQAALAPAEGEAVDAAAEQVVTAVAVEGEGHDAGVLVALLVEQVDVVLQALVVELQLGEQAEVPRSHQWLDGVDAGDARIAVGAQAEAVAEVERVVQVQGAAQAVGGAGAGTRAQGGLHLHAGGVLQQQQAALQGLALHGITGLQRGQRRQRAATQAHRVVDADLAVAPFQHGDLHHPAVDLLGRQVGTRQGVALFAVTPGDAVGGGLQLTNAEFLAGQVGQQAQQLVAAQRAVAFQGETIDLQARTGLGRRVGGCVREVDRQGLPGTQLQGLLVEALLHLAGIRSGGGGDGQAEQRGGKAGQHGSRTHLQIPSGRRMPLLTRLFAGHLRHLHARIADGAGRQGPGDGEQAVDIADVVVAQAIAQGVAGNDGVVAGRGPCPGTAAGQADTADQVAGHQPGGGEATEVRHLAGALAGIAGGDGQRCLVDGQGAGEHLDVIAELAGIEPARAQVGASVGAGVGAVGGVEGAAADQGRVVADGKHQGSRAAGGGAVVGLAGAADVDAEGGHEAAQQRCAVALVHAPGGTRATGIVDAPAGHHEGRQGGELGAGQPRYARGIAGPDALCQAAGGGVPETAGDGACIAAHQAADRTDTGTGRARGINTQQAAVVEPDQAARRGTALGAAGGVAVADGAGAGGAYIARTGGAGVAADPLDHTGRCVVAHQGAGVSAAGHAAAHQVEVADITGVVAEQAAVGAAGAVDGQAADAVPLPVEPAGEGVGQAADGEEAGAAVPQRTAGGVDVVRQDEAAARQAVGGQPLEPIDIGDAVRGGGAAVPGQGPYEGGAGAEAEVGDAEAGQAGGHLAPGAAGEIQHAEVDAPVAGHGAGSRQGQAAVGGVDAITQEDVAAVAGAEGQPGVVAPGQAVGHVEVAACRQLAGATDAEGTAAVEAQQPAGAEVGVQAVAGGSGAQVEAIAGIGETAEVGEREEAQVAVGVAAPSGQVAAAGCREAALPGHQAHGRGIDVQALDTEVADTITERGTLAGTTLQVGERAIAVEAAGFAQDVVVAVRPGGGAADQLPTRHGTDGGASECRAAGVAEHPAAHGVGCGAVAPLQIRIEVGADAPDRGGETGRQAALQLGGGASGDSSRHPTGAAQRLAAGLDVPVGVGDGTAATVVVAGEAAHLAAAGDVAGGVAVADGAVDEVDPDKAADVAGGALADHRAGGVGVGDAAFVMADETADGARRRPHRASGVGLADGTAIAAVAVGSDQPTDIAEAVVRVGAGHIAGGMGARDAAAVEIEADQAADLVAGAGDVATGGGIGDGAAVVGAHQPTADQRTDTVVAGDTAAHQLDVGQGRAGGVAEQADVVGARPVDGQAAEAEALSIEAAGEAAGVAAQGLEARCTPDIGVVTVAAGSKRGAEVEGGAEPVVAGQHRPGITLEHHPGVGEVEAVVGGLGAGIGRSDGGATAGAAGLPGAVHVPVAVGEGDGGQEGAADQAARGGVALDPAAGVGVGQGRRVEDIAHQPAGEGAAVAEGAGHRPRGIGIGQGAVLHGAGQAAHVAQARHAGGRGRPLQRAIGDLADQAADVGAVAQYRAGDVDARQRAAEGPADGADGDVAGDGGIGQGQVAHLPADGLEQAHVVLGTTGDGQAIHGVTEAGEGAAEALQWREALAAVPGARGAGVKAEAGVAARQGDAGAAAQPVAVAVDQREPRVGAGGGDVLVDDDAAGGVQRQGGVSAPADGRIHGDVAGLAATDPGGHRHPGAGQGVGQGVDVEHAVVGVAVEAPHAGAAGIGNGHVVGVDQPFAGLALAGLGQGGDLHVIGHLHVGTAGLDEATIAAVRGTGIEGAGHLDHTAVEVAHEHDLAVLLAQGAGLDHAGVVDHGLEQRIAGIGGEQHLAAVGADQLVILHQRIRCGAVHLDVEQAVAGKVQGHGIAGRQGHAALLGDDHPLVADGAPQQRHRAAIGCGEGALVDHGRRRAVALEAVVAAFEILWVDVEGRGHQAADLDLGTAAEQHAIGVDQEDPAVGIQLAHDLRAVAAHHAVEGDGIAAGLVEGHPLAGADVEALPVDRQLVAGLVDDHLLGAGLADGATAGNHLAAGRQVGRQARHRGQQRTRQDRAGARLASPGLLIGDTPGAQTGIPDQREGSIHDSSPLTARRARESRRCISRRLLPRNWLSGIFYSLVFGLVRALEHVLHAAPASGRPVHHTEGNGDLPHRVDRGGLLPGAEALGHLCCRAQGRLGQQQDELLAADTARQVPLPAALAQQVGELAQHIVTRVVAEGVVDPLEVVDVQADHGERRAQPLPGLQALLHGAAVGQPGERIALGLLVQLAELGPGDLQPGQQRLLDHPGLGIPGFHPQGLLRPLGLRGALGQLPQRAADARGNPQDQPDAQQAHGQQAGEQALHQLLQRRLGCSQGLLRHHAPATQRHAGVAGQHLHAPCVDRLHGAALALEHRIDDGVGAQALANAAGVGVEQHLAVRVHQVDVGRVMVEVLADQRIQGIGLAQVDGAADQPPVLAIGAPDGVGDEDDEVARQGAERRADHRPALLQGLARAQGLAVDAQAVGLGGHHGALGIGHQHGVEAVVLRQQALRFQRHLFRIARHVAQQVGAEAQALQVTGQVLVDAGGELGRIGAVGLQGVLHQRLALDAIGHQQVVGQRRQGCGEREQQDEVAQVELGGRPERHGSCPDGSSAQGDCDPCSGSYGRRIVVAETARCHHVCAPGSGDTAVPGGCAGRPEMGRTEPSRARWVRRLSMLPPPRRIGKHRQRPAEADRREAQQQADAEGGEQVEVVVDALLAQAEVEQGDQQGDAGVELLAQHLRGAVAEDVAEDAAEDAGDDPGHGHHRQRIVQAQRDEHGHEAGADGEEDVFRVLGPAHRVVAEEDVADGAAAEGGEEGDEADAEQVHVAPAGGEGAGHGFGDDGDQVDVGAEGAQAALQGTRRLAQFGGGVVDGVDVLAGVLEGAAHVAQAAGHVGHRMLDVLAAGQRLLDVGVHLVHLPDQRIEGVQRLVGIACQGARTFGGAAHALGDLADGAGHLVDHLVGIAQHALGLAGELAHLIRHDGEATAGFTGARGLDGGVERQQVGLLGDAGDHLQHLADLLGLAAEAVEVGGQLDVGRGAAVYVGDQLLQLLVGAAELGTGAFEVAAHRAGEAVGLPRGLLDRLAVLVDVGQLVRGLLDLLGDVVGAVEEGFCQFLVAVGHAEGAGERLPQILQQAGQARAHLPEFIVAGDGEGVREVAFLGDAVELPGELADGLDQHARGQPGQQQADAQGHRADQQQAAQAVGDGLIEAAQGHVHADHIGLARAGAHGQEDRAEGPVAVGVLGVAVAGDLAAAGAVGEVEHPAAAVDHQGVGELQVHLAGVLAEVAHLFQVLALAQAIGRPRPLQVVVTQQAWHRMSRRTQAVVHLLADVQGLHVLRVADEGGDADQVDQGEGQQDLRLQADGAQRGHRFKLEWQLASWTRVFFERGTAPGPSCRRLAPFRCSTPVFMTPCGGRRQGLGRGLGPFYSEVLQVTPTVLNALTTSAVGRLRFCADLITPQAPWSKVEGAVVHPAGVVHVDAVVVVAGVVDGAAVTAGLVHVAQRAVALEDLGTHLPVVLPLHVVLGGFAGHVREGLVHAAGLPVVDQPRVQLGEAVADFVGRDVERHQRVEAALAVAEGHGLAPAEPVAVHLEHHVAEVVGIVERRVGPVGELVLVVRAGEAEGFDAGVAGAVVEVHGDHVAAVHFAAGVDDQRAVLGAVEVLAGLGVAARAGGFGVVEAFPALQDLAGVGFDHEVRAGRLLAAHEERHHVGELRLLLLVQPHHQFALLVAQRLAALHQRLGLLQGLVLGEGGGGVTHQVLLDAHEHPATALGAAVAGFGDGFAPDPHTLVVLLVAGDLGAVRQLRAGALVEFLGVQAQVGVDITAAGYSRPGRQFGDVYQLGRESYRGRGKSGQDQRLSYELPLHCVAPWVSISSRCAWRGGRAQGGKACSPVTTGHRGGKAQRLGSPGNWKRNGADRRLPGLFTRSLRWERLVAADERSVRGAAAIVAVQPGQGRQQGEQGEAVDPQVRPDTPLRGEQHVLRGPQQDAEDHPAPGRGVAPAVAEAHQGEHEHRVALHGRAEQGLPPQLLRRAHRPVPRRPRRLAPRSAGRARTAAGDWPRSGRCRHRDGRRRRRTASRRAVGEGGRSGRGRASTFRVLRGAGGGGVSPETRLGRVGLAVPVLLVLLGPHPGADPRHRHQRLHRLPPGLPAQRPMADPGAAVPGPHPHPRRGDRRDALAGLVAGALLLPGVRPGILPERHLHHVRVQRRRGQRIPDPVHDLVDTPGVAGLCRRRLADLAAPAPGVPAPPPGAGGQCRAAGRVARLPGDQADHGQRQLRAGHGRYRQAPRAGRALATGSGLPAVPPAAVEHAGPAGRQRPHRAARQPARHQRQPALDPGAGHRRVHQPPAHEPLWLLAPDH
ncbi:hypothetical protein Lal_00008405, partial [Lupinus albus]